jgi:hypothetical protein
MGILDRRCGLVLASLVHQVRRAHLMIALVHSREASLANVANYNVGPRRLILVGRPGIRRCCASRRERRRHTISRGLVELGKLGRFGDTQWLEARVDER